MEPNDGMSIQSEPAREIIRATPELTLATAGRLRTALLDALRPGAQVSLDCSEVSRADLAGLQLLCSAHRAYRGREARFDLRQPSEKLLETARAAGYASVQSICPERRGGPCLWNVEVNNGNDFNG